MLKCAVINATYLNKKHSIKLCCKPSVGDVLAINYLNERVDQVLFVTPMLKKDLPELEGFDLLVYTK
jgi:hypothetical protein